MNLHIPGTMCVGVTLWFGCGGVVSGSRLKNYWSVHVECGSWGLMAVWNRGFISPGLCSGMSFVLFVLCFVLFILCMWGVFW